MVFHPTCQPHYHILVLDIHDWLHVFTVKTWYYTTLVTITLVNTTSRLGARIHIKTQMDMLLFCLVNPDEEQEDWLTFNKKWKGEKLKHYCPLACGGCMWLIQFDSCIYLYYYLQCYFVLDTGPYS